MESVVGMTRSMILQPQGRERVHQEYDNVDVNVDYSFDSQDVIELSIG